MVLVIKMLLLNQYKPNSNSELRRSWLEVARISTANTDWIDALQFCEIYTLNLTLEIPGGVRLIKHKRNFREVFTQNQR